MIKAIIFDFDGVILESADIKTDAFRELFSFAESRQIELIVSHHKENAGISRFVKFRSIYQNILKQELSSEKERELGEKFSQIVFKKVIEAPFVPGAIEFLKGNHQKFKFFVASGTPEEELVQIAKERDVFQYFSRVEGSPKTKVEIGKAILLQEGFDPREVVFVGDADADRDAAESLGVFFVARLHGANSKLKSVAATISDLNGLLKIIEKFESDKR